MRWTWWRVSQGYGWFERTFLTGVRWLVWPLLATQAGVVIERYFTGEPHQFQWGDLRVPSWLLLTWLGVFLFYLLFQARRRVVVEQFTDATGAEQKPDPRGISTLLVGEIAKLRDLYTTVDDSAIPTAVQKNRPLDATIKVEDVAGFLESPAMIETKASVGPIQIPLGALLAFLSRFVRGPRLLGTIHVQGDALVLTAQLSKSGSLQTWRLERSLPPKEATGRLELPQGMVQELAYRMFSDLALTGNVRWQAAKDFAEALEALRVCLRTRENRRLNLQRAERSLIDAQEKDDHLGYVYYNLGVVFSELRRQAESERAQAGARSQAEARTHWNAAQHAFRQQIRLQPDRWEAYYALALTYAAHEPREPRDADYILKRCDRVISMKPGTATTAKALMLKAKANDDRHETEEGIAHRRLAVAEAWSALCRRERSGGGVAAEAQLAASALSDLAGAYCEQRNARRLRVWWDGVRAPKLLGRAVKLAPNDADIRYRLSRAWARKPSREIDELDAALRIDPSRPEWWAELGLLHAQRSKWPKGNGEVIHARYCCEQALRMIDCFVDRDDEKEKAKTTLETVVKAYSQLGPDFVARVSDARERLSVAEMCCAEPIRVADLTEAAKTDDWAGAEARLALGRHDLHRGKYRRAEKRFSEAIARLEADDPDEVARRDARILHAKALRELKEHDQAIEELRNAIGDDPLSAKPREALADTLREIRDYEQAQKVLRDALRWEPDRADLHQKLGHCYRNIAGDHRDAGRRKRALRNAVAQFRQALELSAHHSLDSQLESHYWLARLHKELGDYERAIPYLRRATICKEAAPLIHLLLGEAYLRARAYESAETQLDGVIALVGAEIDATTDYGVSFGDPGWNAGRVVGYAHVLLAVGYAERGVRLGEATEELAAAQEGLRAAKDDGGLANVAYDATEAARLDAEGLIALKEESSSRAVDSFLASLALVPLGETYLHLARAYSLTSDGDGAGIARAARRGIEACRQAIALDVTGRLSPLAKTLQTELAALKPARTNGAKLATDDRGTELPGDLKDVATRTAENS